MTDAMDMFNAMRPPSPAIGGDIRQSSSDLHNLAMVPGSPAYNQRIPKPPCWQCGEDHFPGRSYDHAWMAEPVQIHDEPVAASAVVRRPQVVEVAQPSYRVALYVGRNDTYVVAVEQAPDWESVESFRATEGKVLPLIWMARALGVKVIDKTGGDLLMLEQTDAREFSQDHGRSTPPAGDSGPRRPRLDPDGEGETLPDGAN